VFIVCQNDSDPYLDNQYTERRDGNRFICRGVSAAHIAHIIDHVVLLANRISYSMDIWINRPCDRLFNLLMLYERVRTARLRHAMGRFVDANLEAIKARLWDPERPLFQRMMTAQLAEAERE
jgi:hypothetical protein